MKTKQTAKAIESLTAQVIDGKKIKGGSDKNTQVLKGRVLSKTFNKPNISPIEPNSADLKLTRNLKK